MDLCRAIVQAPRTVNRQPVSIFNVWKNEPKVAKEEDNFQDILSIERPSLQTTAVDFVDNRVQQEEQRQKLIYANNQEWQRRRIPPRFL